MRAFLATVLSIIATGVMLIAYGLLNPRVPSAYSPYAADGFAYQGARPVLASQRVDLVLRDHPVRVAARNLQVRGSCQLQQSGKRGRVFGIANSSEILLFDVGRIGTWRELCMRDAGEPRRKLRKDDPIGFGGLRACRRIRPDRDDRGGGRAGEHRPPREPRDVIVIDLAWPGRCRHSVDRFAHGCL